MAEDGGAYTRAEFVEYFGAAAGGVAWAAAPAAGRWDGTTAWDAVAAPAEAYEESPVGRPALVPSAGVGDACTAPPPQAAGWSAAMGAAPWAAGEPAAQ